MVSSTRWIRSDDRHRDLDSAERLMPSPTSPRLIQIGGAKRQPTPEKDVASLVALLRAEHGLKAGIRLSTNLARHAADKGDVENETVWRQVATALQAEAARSRR